MSFSALAVLKPYSETAFRLFYDQMLSNEVFARHFQGPEHIAQLIRRLIDNFEQSLTDSIPDLCRRFQRVGVIHYRHNIPYEVFISGSRLLASIFSQLAAEHEAAVELTLLTEKYFRAVTEAMAKGYFDEFMADNLNELENLKALVKDTTAGAERSLLVRHYDWLGRLLRAVRDEDIPTLQGLVSEDVLQEQETLKYIRRHIDEIGSVYGSEDLDRIRFRLLVNANSISFYLQQKIYSEALSLVVNLLEVYKLTLILDTVVNNIIVRKAEHLIEEKSRLSETDPLTKVFNRRKLADIMEGLVMRSHRTAQPLTLSLFDIDDFKAINDRFGHLVGDRVLIELAQRLTDHTRKHDVIARFGGEEFVVIFADTGLSDATRVADKIRRAVGEHEFAEVGHVTVSAGLAELNSMDDDVTLWRRADERLYAAKADGKNKVCS